MCPMWSFLKMGWEGEKEMKITGRHKRKIDGYISVVCHEHPRSNKKGRIFEHILVAEKKLERFLLPKEVVHHINGIRSDNAPENIYVCSNDAEHKLIHLAIRAYQASGNAEYRKCIFCGKWDDPVNLYISPTNAVRHRDCFTKYQMMMRRSK
jgi:hypothetical protein